MAAELPNFTKRWEAPIPAPTPINTRKHQLTRMDKFTLIVTTAIITATATLGWAVVMNGVGKLPVLRVHFYVPGAEDVD